MTDSSSREPRLIFGWANAMAQALEIEGIDCEPLFREAEVPYPISAEPYVEMATRKASLLHRLAVEASGNPAFGLKVAACLQPITLYAFGYSVYASSTLHELCIRLERYFRLVSDNARHQLTQASDEYVLYIDEMNEAVSHEALDAWIGFLIHTVRKLYQPNYAPVLIELVRPEPATHVEDFKSFFRAPVIFSADRNAIHFTASDMFAPLPMADTELSRRSDELVIERLARFDREDIIRRVEAEIIKLLPTGECSKERVAAKLNMSLSNLYNKLEKRQTSYQEVLESLRSGLARQYIDQPDMPISEITYLLGFSDTSNFSRAFRRWTGQSPSSYRKSKER